MKYTLNQNNFTGELRTLKIKNSICDIVTDEDRKQMYELNHIGDFVFTPAPLKEYPDLISVIISFYNRPQYIEQCLESIYNQTYKNIEIIVIDDGSDKPLEIEGNFKLYRNEKNLGAPGAQNRGIKLAKGKYIKIFDDDDLAMPDMLEVGYAAICDNDKLWSMGGNVLVDIDGKEVAKYKEIQQKISNDNILYYITRGGGLSYCASLFKKELFDKVGLFNELLWCHHDTEFFLRVINAGIYPLYLEHYMYKWRQGSTIIRNTNDPRNIKARKIWDKMKEQYNR